MNKRKKNRVGRTTNTINWRPKSISPSKPKGGLINAVQHSTVEDDESYTTPTPRVQSATSTFKMYSQIPPRPSAADMNRVICGGASAGGTQLRNKIENVLVHRARTLEEEREFGEIMNYKLDNLTLSVPGSDSTCNIDQGDLDQESQLPEPPAAIFESTRLVYEINISWRGARDKTLVGVVYADKITAELLSLHPGQYATVTVQTADIRSIPIKDTGLIDDPPKW